jgi:ABC-2 type transport system permease protein
MSYQRVHQAVGVRLFWNSIWARAYPRVVGAARERSWMFFETVLPFMATVSYVYVYRAIGAPEEFIGFVIVGGAMTAFWLNVLWPANCTGTRMTATWKCMCCLRHQ